MRINSESTGLAIQPHRLLVVWLAAIAVLILAGWVSSASASATLSGPPIRRPVMLRAKSPLSRQPRPVSAPIKHLDQRADHAAKLIGIESLDELDHLPLPASSAQE